MYACKPLKKCGKENFRLLWIYTILKGPKENL